MSDQSSRDEAFPATRPKIPRPVMDDVDRRLLVLLQADGRMSNVALAEAVGLAPSTVHARVRRLVDTGVIRGFFADVDPAAVGRTLRAMIAVSLRSEFRGRIRDFVRSVGGLDAVIDTYFLAGNDDFLLHVAAWDTDDLRRIVEYLNAREEVAGTHTSLVFDHVRG